VGNEAAQIETPIPYCGGKWDRGSTRKRGSGMFRAPSTTGEGASGSRSFGNGVNPRLPHLSAFANREGGRAYARQCRRSTGRYGFPVQETGRTVGRGWAARLPGLAFLTFRVAAVLADV
jgi:hypothetical protein